MFSFFKKILGEETSPLPIDLSKGSEVYSYVNNELNNHEQEILMNDSYLDKRGGILLQNGKAIMDSAWESILNENDEIYGLPKLSESDRKYIQLNTMAYMAYGARIGKFVIELYDKLPDTEKLTPEKKFLDTYFKEPIPDFDIVSVALEKLLMLYYDRYDNNIPLNHQEIAEVIYYYILIGYRLVIANYRLLYNK